MAQQGQPQQVAPAAPAAPAPPVGNGFNVLLIQDYLQNVQASAPNQPQPYEQVVDHFWQHFLAHYFCQDLRFGVEREAFTHSDSREAADVLVSNHRDGGRHQVIIVEAKRFPGNTPAGWETTYDWQSVHRSVRNHMVHSRMWLGTVQTTYGMAAVGDKVRFYYMSMHNRQLREWDGTPDGATTARLAQTFDIHDPEDQERIHELILAMRGPIIQNTNNY